MFQRTSDLFLQRFTRIFTQVVRVDMFIIEGSNIFIYLSNARSSYSRVYTDIWHCLITRQRQILIESVSQVLLWTPWKI